MRRFFGERVGNMVYIEGDEFNHLKNVLRMNVGDQLIAFLNDENEYVCQIEKLERGRAVCVVTGTNVCECNPRKNIVLFQAITKGPKFEFIVQKATEIGITRIVPFVSDYVIAKVNENKVERLKSIAMNACKQCERTIVPVIDNALTVEQVVDCFKDFDIVLFANERAASGERPREIVKAKNIAIIVGSEGGFSEREKDLFIEKGAVTISLGKRILRAETASVAMMSLISILSGN